MKKLQVTVGLAALTILYLLGSPSLKREPEKRSVAVSFMQTD